MKFGSVNVVLDELPLEFLEMCRVSVAFVSAVNSPDTEPETRGNQNENCNKYNRGVINEQSRGEEARWLSVARNGWLERKFGGVARKKN